MKSLGIDLGSNSLGWGIIDDADVLDSGVVIFDEGIRREKGKDSLETPAAVRRAKRMGRRLKFRRKIRKYKVLKLLIKNGMCPLSLLELETLKTTGGVPDSPKFREWLKSVPSNVPDHVNPYYARAMAATQKIEPMLLGRAIYHLAQRRGFKSSRKEQLQAEENQSQRAKELGVVKGEIKKISELLAEKQCTLGQYFYVLNQRNEKIRQKHLGRVEHYQVEFNKIAEVQGLPDDLRTALFHALFSQRPLRPQSFLAGKCPLEVRRPFSLLDHPVIRHGKPMTEVRPSRCLLGHPLFEEFRMYSFLNTIRLDDGSQMRFLTADEREKIIPCFKRKSRDFEFETIVKTLFPRKGKAKNEPLEVKFNYNYKKSVPSCCVIAQLNELLGIEDYKDWKHTVSRAGKTITYDYQTVFDALVFFDDDQKLVDFAKQKLGFNDEQIKALLKISIPDGNAQYSLCAIRKILPFLKTGMELSRAVFLAKLPDLLGHDVFYANQGKILSDIDELCRDYKAEQATASKSVKVIPLTTRLHGYLEDTWHLTPDKLALLYHHSATAYEFSDDDAMLPPVNLGMMRNPLVQRSLTVLRRLVNELRHTGKIDADTQINIELARAVNDRNTRMAWATYQAELEQERKDAVQRIKEFAEDPQSAISKECAAELLKRINNPHDPLVDRYLLREEQNLCCLYTGNPIGIGELIDGHSWDIEHTVPRSRSGDNSNCNKTLCDAKFNRDVKKGCLPRELANWNEIDVRLRPWREKLEQLETTAQQQKRIANAIPQDEPERKSAARQKYLVTLLKWHYWKTKLRRFDATADDLNDGFMNRQLVDTGIMTRHAVEFLRSRYPKTYPVNGVATAWARKMWGLQPQDEKKDREEHIHHAVDALVIAALSRERFRRICTAFKDNGITPYTPQNKELFYASLIPFTNFRKQVANGVANILVKSYVRHTELKQTWCKCTYLTKGLQQEDGSQRHVVPSGGDTIRGQLHAETFYGRIIDPKDNAEKYVVRKFITDDTVFAKISDFDKIVDRNVAETLKAQISDYLQAHGDKKFKDAVNQPLWMKKPNADGSGGVRILRVRCYAQVTTPHQLKKQLTPSAQEYKNYYYVNSAKDSNFRVALFHTAKGRQVQVENLLEYAQKIKQADYVPWEKRTDLGEFLGFLQPGKAVLLYENTPEELKAFDNEKLSARLYRFVKIENGGRMTMRFHKEARDAKALGELFKAGASSINYETAHKLLFMSPSKYLPHALFEDIDFKFSIGGEITFLL